MLGWLTTISHQSVFVGFLQDPRITVLATAADTENGDGIASRPVRDHSALAIMRQSQAREKISAGHASLREAGQRDAECYDRID